MTDYDYRVLAKVNLAEHHVPTGFTQHYRGQTRLPAPAQLWIARLPDAPGFYLLYLDELGQEMTDTFHESVEQAMAQAESEFRITPGEWELTDRSVL